MKKYSANYCKSNSNFIIKGIKENNKNIEYMQTIKIVKNIINRGIPTKMSKYLQQKYSYDLENDENYLRLFTNEKQEWSKTIKGAENSIYNPALVFYNEIIEEYLGEYGFIKNLIIPEIEVNEILDSPIKELERRTDDFYIPQLKLDIEIDGLQHNKTVNDDRSKDLLQKRNGIKVIRIKTEDLVNKTNNLKVMMDEIKRAVSNSQIINEYKNIETSQEKIELIQIIRLQIAILELLKTGNLDFDNKWNLNVIGADKNVVETAIEDLKIWFDMIFKLQKIEKNIPNYTINESEKKSIKIDIDIFKKYDDSLDDENIIYIRNDYFEDEEKNYYKVECDKKYKYNLHIEDKKDKENLLNIIKNIFGYDEFREKQAEIIMRELNGKDTVGILPTGQGKSMCYQIATILQPAITFIVAPLKSLLKDQKDNMKKIFITNNEKIDSSMNANERKKVLNNINKAKYQMIWISPERFQSDDFRETILNINKENEVGYAVIDEVHCISEWGHSFRPSYLLLIKTIRKYMPEAVLIGLTATASSKVIKDIKIEFEINDEAIITTTDFIRKELKFQVVNCEESQKESILFQKMKKLQDDYLVLDNENNKPGIVFSNFAGGDRGCVKLVGKIASLQENRQYKKNIDYFIGSNKPDTYMDDKEFDKHKEKVQDRFKKNELSLLIATKSFGMGIDKENVWYIIHYGMPNSIEELYQEVGRAGRNGKTAYCYVLHSKSNYKDGEKQEFYSANTEISKIKERTYDRKNWGRGDAIDQMKLLFENIDENEIKSIYGLYNKYIKGNNSFIIEEKNRDNIITNIQKYIYKLSLLGIVTDWSITYSSNVIFKGSCETLTNEQIRQNIEKYINKYELNFSFDKLENKEYKSIKNIMDNNSPKDDIYNYIKVICTWYNENILYNRRKAIQEVDNFLTDIKNKGDCTEEFNKKIYDYFRNDDYAIGLQKITENNKEFENDFITALKQLYKNNEILDIEGIKSVRTSLGRFLIENRNNYALYLLEGIIELIINNDNMHDEDFESALESASKSNSNNEIYEMILHISQKMSGENKIKLGNVIMKYFNTREQLTKNYEVLNNNKALLEVININFNKISKMEGDVINGRK